MSTATFWRSIGTFWTKHISPRLEEEQARRDRVKNGITDGDFIQRLGMMIAQERQSARTEFKAAAEAMQRTFEARVAALEERLKTVPGKLPVAKIWRPESVTYQAEFVCYEGALYSRLRPWRTKSFNGR